MPNEKRTDEVSSGLMRFLNTLSPEDRDELTDALRDPRTFIAEDLDDLLAVLKHIEAQRDAEGENKPSGKSLT